MKDLKKYKYDKEKTNRTTIIFITTLVWLLSLIFLDKLFQNINLSLIIFIVALLFIGSIIKYVNIAKNKLNENRKYSIIEISLIVYSAYLMLSNYTIYSLWNVIFRIISPSLTIGFIFIASFTVGLFLSNKLVRLIFIPLIFIYPIEFLNIDSKWMIYGALASSLCLVEIIYGVLNNLNESRHRIEELNSTVIIILLKIILPILLLSILLFFFVGYEKLASFSNIIYIKKWHDLILFIPFIILIILLFTSLNLKIMLTVFLIGNLITTNVLNDFTNMTNYNNFDFLIANLAYDFETKFELLIILLLNSIVAALIVSSINFAYIEWKIYNEDFKVLTKIDININKFKKNDSYNYKFYILKISLIESFFLVDDKMNLHPFLNVTKNTRPELLHKHLIILNLKNSIALLLPLNSLFIFLMTAYSFTYNSSLSILLNYYSSCWTLYINIFFSLILIFWDKFELKFLGSWSKNNDAVIKKKDNFKSKKFGSKQK